MTQTKEFLMKMGSGIRNNFHLLTNDHLVQNTVFEVTVEFGIFYRYAKKTSVPLRTALHNWRKTEAIRDRRNKGEKILVNRTKMSVFH